MLSQLTVRNLAIVEEASIAFGPGLNIITGETGAGKSLLMGALHLVLGGRADKSAIREGAPDARVEAAFRTAGPAAGPVAAALDAAGLPPCEDGLLLVRRLLSPSGPGRCFVNDAPAAAQTLRRLGALLVDIHGPCDHHSLLDPDFQRALLDDYGDCTAARSLYRAAWDEWRRLREHLESLRGDAADIAREIDSLQFITDEISRAALTPADEDDLVALHDRAANAGEILAAGTDALNALSDGEDAVFDRLAAVQNQLAALARLLPAAEEWRSEARAAAMQIQELARSMAGALSQIDADPERLLRLEERMALVQRLKRKYGRTVADVLETGRRARARLEDLSSRTEKIERLEAAIAAAAEAMRRAGAALSEHRLRAAARLAPAITSELRGLGFLKSGFDISLSPAPPSADGLDRVSFGFAPNPGEPMRELRAIASSGEIARVMLAVKTVLSAHDRIPVLVFDEIDANIGGEVGRAVGRRLRAVARSHQVICITHLPQSAVYGQTHFRVEKRVLSGRTFTRIRPLDPPGRVDEIVRMLGGKGSSGAVEAHARELLSEAAAEPGKL